MERGKPDVTVYTLELPQHLGRTMSYPDGELWSYDEAEASAYAREKGYQLIANTYEWADSELVEDFSVPEEDGDDDEDVAEEVPPGAS
jgi:hypothetical protein